MVFHDPDPHPARLPDEHRAMVWHFASLLLSSPDEGLIKRLEPVHRASHLLPDEVGGPLRATVVHLEQVPLAQLQEEYAETFAAPEAATGSTGPMARICAVLEEAATLEPGTARSLLADQQAVLRNLQVSLTAKESGWAGAVAAVTATLPSSGGGAR